MSQKALGLAFFTLAGVADLVGILVLFYAYIFSGGHDGIPRGIGQQSAWFAAALTGVAAALLATFFAERYIHRGRGALWVLASLIAACAGYAVWWFLAEEFRSPY